MQLDNKKNRLLLYFMVAVSLLLIFNKIVFGNYDFLYYDVGADTSNLYYPIYLELIRKIKTLDFSMWSFGQGLGNSLLNYQATVCDPFTYVIVLLGIIFGNGFVGRAIAIAFCLKIFIIGGISYRWLDCFEIDNRIKIFASYMIAFNSYVFLWGQHGFFGTASVFIVFAYYLIEKTYITGRRYWPVSIYVACTVCLNFYLSYMIVISMSLYLLIRYLWTKEKIVIVALIKDVLSYIGLVLLGYGISAVILFPNLYNLFKASSRLDGTGAASILSVIGEKTFAIYNKNYYAGMAGRLFGNNFIGKADNFPHSNYYEAIQLSLSILVLIALPQVVWNFVTQKKLKIKKKIIALVGIVLPIYLVLFQLGGYMYNGFQYSITRFTFALMPLMGLLIAYYLNQLFTNRYKNNILIWAITALAIVWLIRKLTYKYAIDVSGWYYGIVILITIICFMTLIVHRYNGNNMLLYLVMLSCIIQVSCDNYITVNDRGMYNRDEINYTWKEQTDAAISALKEYDDSFYRIARSYMCFSYNDGYVCGYNGVSEYNSTGNRYVWEYIDSSCKDADKWTGFVFDFDEQESFFEELDVKYYLSMNDIHEIDDVDADNWQLVDTVRGIIIYKNLLYKGNCVVKGKGDSEYYELAEENSGNLNVSVDAHEGQKLVTSIPYEAGWNIYINGKKCAIEKTNNAFIAVNLDEGNNNVKFIYRTIYMWQGIIVSIVSLFLLTITIIFCRKKEKTND